MSFLLSGKVKKVFGIDNQEVAVAMGKAGRNTEKMLAEMKDGWVNKRGWF